MPLIDLRSDTVTKPTAAMRQAMFEAEVGDDVYQEDPTVNRLETRAAEILGKEAALFVPTGTMGNTIGIKLLTRHGQEVIAESRGHLLNYELSMAAWFAGCLIRPAAAADGILTWGMIEPSSGRAAPHWAATGCIELENTHNMAAEPCIRSQISTKSATARTSAARRPSRWRAPVQRRRRTRPPRERSLREGRYRNGLLRRASAPVGSMLAGPLR